MKQVEEVREEIENKYLSQKKILIGGYQKAKYEKADHQTKKDHRRYKSLFKKYAYPLGAFKQTREQEELREQILEQ